MPSLLFSALLALAVAAGAWATRALTAGGAAAATLVGTGILLGTGWAGGATLAVFFLGSSLVSRLAESRTPAWVDARGSRRDAVQVAANGGVALLGAALVAWRPLEGYVVLCCALAAAAADTWATGLGQWSRRDPRLVTTFRPVPRGTSGGVSVEGTLGGVAGAALVAVVAGGMIGSRELVWLAALVGLGGMVADSLLGATLQGRFGCPACGLASERRRHRCGTPTRHMGGLSWLDNDMVNLLATALAGVAGWFAAPLLSP